MDDLQANERLLLLYAFAVAIVFFFVSWLICPYVVDATMVYYKWIINNQVEIVETLSYKQNNYWGFCASMAGIPIVAFFGSKHHSRGFRVYFSFIPQVLFFAIVIGTMGYALSVVFHSIYIYRNFEYMVNEKNQFDAAQLLFAEWGIIGAAICFWHQDYYGNGGDSK